MTTVTVVVPSFRRPDALSRCIAGIGAMWRAPREVVVVLRPDDQEGGVAASRAGARVVHVFEPGHLPPLQAAARACATDVMAVLDDDAVPRPSWLTEIERAFARPGTVCVTGPADDHGVAAETPVVGRDGARAVARLVARSGRTWYGGFAGLPSSRACAHAGLMDPVPVSHLQGGNAAYHCEALAHIGFDMNLNRGAAIGYEADLALALSRYGRVLFDPRMIVDHFPAPRQGAPSRGDHLAYLRDYTHNLFYVAAKHFSSAERLRFLAYMAAIGQEASPGLLRAFLATRSEGASAVRVLRVTRAERRVGARLGRLGR